MATMVAIKEIFLENCRFVEKRQVHSEWVLERSNGSRVPRNTSMNDDKKKLYVGAPTNQKPIIAIL